MHFKNSAKSTNLTVLLKAVKEVKSTMSIGKQFHTSTTRFTKKCGYNICTASLFGARKSFVNFSTVLVGRIHQNNI